MEQAFEDYSMVISLEGKNVTAWLGIGKVELKRGKLLNARTAFGYALQYAEANYNAIKHTKEAVLKQDDDFGRLENALLHLLDAHSMQGVLDQQENKLEEALGWFTRGLRLVFGEDADKVRSNPNHNDRALTYSILPTSRVKSIPRKWGIYTR